MERHWRVSICPDIQTSTNVQNTRQDWQRQNKAPGVLWPHSLLAASRSLAMMVKSSRVVVSPLISPWVANSRRQAAHDLTGAGLGQGLGKANIVRRRASRSPSRPLAQLAFQLLAGRLPLSSVTKADMAWPQLVGAATTAASATLGCATSADPPPWFPACGRSR